MGKGWDFEKRSIWKGEGILKKGPYLELDTIWVVGYGVPFRLAYGGVSFPACDTIFRLVLVGMLARLFVCFPSIALTDMLDAVFTLAQ